MVSTRKFFAPIAIAGVIIALVTACDSDPTSGMSVLDKTYVSELNKVGIEGTPSKLVKDGHAFCKDLAQTPGGITPEELAVTGLQGVVTPEQAIKFAQITTTLLCPDEATNADLNANDDD